MVLNANEEISTLVGWVSEGFKDKAVALSSLVGKLEASLFKTLCEIIAQILSYMIRIIKY